MELVDNLFVILNCFYLLMSDSEEKNEQKCFQNFILIKKKTLKFVFYFVFKFSFVKTNKWFLSQRAFNATSKWFFSGLKLFKLTVTLLWYIIYLRIMRAFYIYKM